MSLKIMVVDDHAAPLASLKAMLESLGSEVVPFTSAGDAEAQLEALDFDAVFVDAQMADLSGFEVTKAVRHSPKNRKIPVIVVSDQKDTQAMRLAFKAGASYFISKPVTMDGVQSLYTAVLGPMLMQRRAFARVPFEALVTCTLDPDGDREFVARSLNISQTGLLIECSTSLQVGQTLKLRFCIPSADEPLQLKGKLVRQAGPNRFGVLFLQPAILARKAIQVFIVPVPAPNTVKTAPKRNADQQARLAEAAAKAAGAGAQDENSLLKPVSYIAAFLLAISYLTFRVVYTSTADLSLQAARGEKLACVVQPEPPSLTAQPSDAPVSQFVTVSPAVVRVPFNQGETVSYPLTLTNHSKQVLNFQLTAADLLNRAGGQILALGSESPDGIAVGVQFSQPIISAKPGQTTSVDVHLGQPRDPTVRSVLITLNGTDRVMAWGDRVAQLSLGTMASFVDVGPSNPEQSSNDPSQPQISMANYTVCQWRPN